MRWTLGLVALLLAATLLDSSVVRAQGVIVQPPGGNPNLKRLLDAYEKLVQDPAYDYLEMKNTQGEVIRSGRFGGPAEKAIELGERRLATARSRGLYGELASTWTIADLGEVYRAAGLTEKEVALHKEYADWCAQHYGPKNSETRMALDTLVRSYLNAKQEAKALAVYNEAFGVDGPPSEAKLQMLGTFQQHHLIAKNYERYCETAVQFARLQDALKPPGPNSPSQPQLLQSAYVLLQAERKSLAEKLIDDAWTRSQKEKGPDAPETIAALGRNAADYLALRQAEKAVARYEELVKHMVKAPGPDHADTLWVRNNLALAHLAGNAPEKAQPLLKELHTTTKEKLGVEHPLTGQVVYNLSTCMEAAKKLDQAEQYLREYVEIQKKVGKADDAPAVTGALALLGTNLMKQEKWVEAEKVLRQTLEIRRNKAPRDWTTSNTESLLGAALLGQKKYEEAETLLLAGYKGLSEKRFHIPVTVQAQRVNEAVERLIRLYEATDRPAKAEDYRKLLPK